MQLKDKLAALEAILFACGDSVETDKIADAIGIELNSVDDLVKLLNDRYDNFNSALIVKRLNKSYQLCTKKEYSEYIKAAAESKKQTPLSNAAMEALTIVAYNQPVTKSFVENVRGIDSSSVINTLVDKGLLEEAGRLEVPGRPVAYRTTNVFLRSFGLSSLDELPPLADSSIAEETLLLDGEDTENSEDMENSGEN